MKPLAYADHARIQVLLEKLATERSHEIEVYETQIRYGEAREVKWYRLGFAPGAGLQVPGGSLYVQPRLSLNDRHILAGHAIACIEASGADWSVEARPVRLRDLADAYRVTARINNSVWYANEAAPTLLEALLLVWRALPKPS